MKKGFLVVTLVLFAGLMFLSVGMLTAAAAPDMIKIENKYKDDKKGTVNLSHKKHSVDYKVACTDCHNPHPSSHVKGLLTIGHTHVQRPSRLPMSVDQPGVCFKCHADLYAKSSMPSHHPIIEGKESQGCAESADRQFEPCAPLGHLGALRRTR